MFMVCMSTCPGQRPRIHDDLLTYSGDAKNEASASFVKTTAVSCPTCYALASLETYEGGRAGQSQKNTIQPTQTFLGKGRGQCPLRTI